MALSQGLLNSYWNRYNQRKALTGFAPGYQEQRGLLDPMLDYGVALKKQEDEMAMRGRQLNMQEQAARDSARAATISGIAQTGGLLASTGLTYKALQNQSAYTDMIKRSLLGPDIQTPDIPSTGMFAGPNPWTSGAGSGGGTLNAGVGSGSPGMLQTPGYTAPVLQSQTTFPAAEAGGAVAPVAGVGSSMLAAAPSAIGLAAGQYGLGQITKPWMEQHGMKYTNQGWTYAGLPGAFAGASLDIGKKTFQEVHNFIDSIF